MGILTYLIFLRIKRIFDFKSHPIKTMSILLLMGLFVYYGFLFAQLYHSNKFQQKVLSQDLFREYLILALMIITFLKGFIPVYVPMKKVISSNYPISQIKKYLFNLINEFIYPFYFSIVLFVLTFSLLMDKKGSKFLIISLFGVIISHLFRRMFQFFLEFRIKGKSSSFILGTSLICAILYFFLFNKYVIYVNYTISFSIMIVLLSFNFLIERKGKNPKRIIKKDVKKRIHFKWFLKVLFNNHSIRIMLFVAVLFKLFFILINWDTITRQIATSSELKYFLNLFLSPLILFTYIFNNYFAFSKSMWLTMNKVGLDLYSYSLQIFKLFIIPLIIDTIFAMSVYILLGDLNYKNMLIYLNSGFVLFVIGILNSFYFPKKFQGTFSFRGNTTVRANLISITSVGIIIYLSTISPLISTLFSISMAFSIYYFTRNKILNNRYKLFETLFN
jgi:hypothetical protein